MDRYQASVVNRLTDKGAGWGLIGLLIVHWPKVAAATGITGGGTWIIGKLIG